MRKIEEEDIDSEQSEDLNEEQLIAMNRHFRNKRSLKASKMTTEMETLYKEALMDTFFGRFEEASKKLKNHIALYPDHSEAYHLLGTMYEELGEYRNAVQYFFMSAYLSSPNFQKWKKVGEMSFELQMYNQSAYCFGRALKIENYNIDLMSRRAQAFEHCHQSKKAISTYKKILSITFSLPILKQYAKLRFKREQFKIARQILMQYNNHQKDPHTAYMICETFLRQSRFQQLLDYLKGFVEYIKETDPQFKLDSLNLEFTILLFISLVRQGKTEFQTLNVDIFQVKKTIIEAYDESYSKEYDLLISYMKTQPSVLRQMISFLIKFKPHKTVSNYLIYSEFLKNSSQYQEAIKILKQGLCIHKNSVQLTSQLNHIKVVSGNWKEIKRGEVFDFSKNKVKNDLQNKEDIFYSDEESYQNKQFNHQEVNQFTLEENFQLQLPKRSRILNTPKSVRTKNIEPEDPQIIKRLLINCSQTLKSIVQNNDQNNLKISYFKQVEDCINFILNLTEPQKEYREEEKEGLFNRTYRRRRYLTSKQSNRQNFVHQNLTIIINMLENILQFMREILLQEQFQKVKQLTQTISKVYFFRWQNKSTQLKQIKKQLYEIGLLSCLTLQKYETAVFFIKYLAHRQPENSFYLLIVNYLIHNSNTKICMNSLLGKYVNRNSIQKNIKKLQPNNPNFNSVQSADNSVIIDENNNFGDDLGSENLSYPRKMSNISNLSDILKDNTKLNYLFGIEYMETGCFDLAIGCLLKAVKKSQGEIKKTIWLCICLCFLQISSSRTCHSKLPYTNSSTYSFLEYLNNSDDWLQKTFNKARLLAQLKLNSKAIYLFNSILQKKIQKKSEQEIKFKSAHCLMCIYKEMQDWQMVNLVANKYFSLKDWKPEQKEETLN